MNQKRVFIKFESELQYSTIKFSGAAISVQEVFHSIDRKKNHKLNYKLDRIILWDYLNHQEITSRYIDADTYIVLKRMPTHVPKALTVTSDLTKHHTKQQDTQSPSMPFTKTAPTIKAAQTDDYDMSQMREKSLETVDRFKFPVDFPVDLFLCEICCLEYKSNTVLVTRCCGTSLCVPCAALSQI